MELRSMREPVIVVYRSWSDDRGMYFDAGTTFGEVRDELHADENTRIMMNIGSRSFLDWESPDDNHLVMRPGFYSVIFPGQIRNISFWDYLWN